MSQNVTQTKPKKKKQPKRKNIGKNATNIGVRGVKNETAGAKPNRNPLGLMRAKLTGQEAGIVQYLMGLTTPNLPCRVPVVLGEFELDTNTYSYVFNGTVSATAAGFAYIGAAQDGWYESGNDAGPSYQSMAFTTGGYPVWNSVAGGAAAATAAVNVASSADHAKSQLPILDPGFNVGSRYRNTSILLSVWPDSPATTTQGDICLAALSSEQALNNGALNSATFASITAYPQEYVSHMELPLANWNPENQGHAFPVPFSENCFVIQYMPTTGTTTCGHFAAVAVVTGAAASQTFRYRIEYKYETTAPLSYLTGVESSVSGSPVASSQLVPHLAALRPHSPKVGPAKLLSGLPVHAMKQADPSIFDKIRGPALGALGKALGGAVSSGIKMLPYVGGALGGVWDSLFS